MLACVQCVTKIDTASQPCESVSMHWSYNERPRSSFKLEGSTFMSSSALIDAVRRRRPLWDTSDVHHHNRLVIMALWQEIAEELGVNMILAKSKWRGLRDYYRQQLRRNSELPPENQTNSNWAHFNEMSFIGAAVTPRTGRIKEEASPPTDLDIHDAIDHSWQEDLVAQNWPEPVTGYRKHDSELAPSPNEDDDLHFFKSLIPDLKGLPRSKKVLLRLKIQQLIYDEVYKSADNSEKDEDPLSIHVEVNGNGTPATHNSN